MSDKKLSPLKRAEKALGPHGSPTHRIKIYTKTGDKGESSLYSGERRSKDNFIFHALGDVDELNSAIGVAKEHLKSIDEELVEKLSVVQSRLLDVGSYVATPDTTSSRVQKRVEFSADHVSLLEEWIDDLDRCLPALQNFILPSGGLASSHLHLARAIGRRAERSLVQLYSLLPLDEPLPVVCYINRLSDLLFMMARRAAQLADEPETIYKKE